VKLHTTLLLSALACAALPAQADLALAEKSACLNCHDMDKKMVGPAFKAIAAKYAQREDGQTYLVDKISKGGTGVWGAIPMPGMAYLPPTDIATMAKWILTLP
jgi:cytochrome c